MSANNMQNKHIVLTGASRGIGLELCRQLVAGGASITTGVRSPTQAQELKQLAAQHKDKLKVYQLDVTRDDSVRAFAEALGEHAVDVLINNAGVNVDSGHDASDLPLKALAETLDANTYGPIRMVQALHAHLERSKAAKIANISSVMGSIGENESGGSVAYRMSKSALNQYSRCLALEQQGWVVLALHPGWVKTRMGGQNAQIDTQASAKGLIEVIERASRKESGQFFRYSGEPVAW